MCKKQFRFARAGAGSSQIPQIHGGCDRGVMTCPKLDQCALKGRLFRTQLSACYKPDPEPDCAPRFSFKVT